MTSTPWGTLTTLFEKSLQLDAVSDKTLRGCLQSLSTEQIDLFFHSFNPTTSTQQYFIARVARLLSHIPTLSNLLSHDDIGIQRYAANSKAFYTSSSSPLLTAASLQEVLRRLSPFLRGRVIWNLAKQSVQPIRGTNATIAASELLSVVEKDWGLQVALPLLWSCESVVIRSYLSRLNPRFKFNLSYIQAQRLRKLDFDLFVELMILNPRSFHAKLKRQITHDLFITKGQLSISFPWTELKVSDSEEVSLGSRGRNSTLSEKTGNEVSMISHSDQKKILRRHYELVVKQPNTWLPRLNVKLVEKYLTRSRLAAILNAELKANKDEKPDLKGRLNWIKKLNSEQLANALIDGLGDRWLDLQYSLEFWDTNPEVLECLPVDLRDLIAASLYDQDQSSDTSSDPFIWLKYRSVPNCTSIIEKALRFESDSDRRTEAIETLFDNATINNDSTAHERTINFVYDRYRNDTFIYSRMVQKLYCLKTLSQSTCERVYKELIKDNHRFSAELFRLLRLQFREPLIPELEDYLELVLASYSSSDLILEDLPHDLHELFIQRFLELDAKKGYLSNIAYVRVVKTLQTWNKERDSPFPLEKYPSLLNKLKWLNDTDMTLEFALDYSRNQVPYEWLLTFWSKVKQPNCKLLQNVIYELFVGRWEKRCSADRESTTEILIGSEEDETSNSEQEDGSHVTFIEAINHSFHHILQQKYRHYKGSGYIKQLSALFKILRTDPRYDIAVDLMAAKCRGNILNPEQKGYITAQLYAACAKNDEQITSLIQELFKEAKETEQESGDVSDEERSNSHETDSDTSEEVIKEECIERFEYTEHRYRTILRIIATLINHLSQPNKQFDLFMNYFSLPYATTCIIRDGLSRFCYFYSMDIVHSRLSILRTSPFLDLLKYPYGRPVALNKNVVRLEIMSSLWNDQLALLEKASEMNDPFIQRWVCKAVMRYPCLHRVNILTKLIEYPQYYALKIHHLMRNASEIPNEHRASYIHAIVDRLPKYNQSTTTSQCFFFFLRDHIDFVPDDVIESVLGSVGQDLGDSYILNATEIRCVIFEYIAATARRLQPNYQKSSPPSYPQELSYELVKDCVGTQYFKSAVAGLTKEGLKEWSDTNPSYPYRDRVQKFIDFVIETLIKIDMKARNAKATFRVFSWKDRLSASRLPLAHEGQVLRVACEILREKLVTFSNESIPALNMAITLDIALSCLFVMNNEEKMAEELGTLCNRILLNHPDYGALILSRAFKSFFSRNLMAECLFGVDNKEGKYTADKVASSFISFANDPTSQEPSVVPEQLVMHCVLIHHMLPDQSSYSKLVTNKLLNTKFASLVFSLC